MERFFAVGTGQPDPELIDDHTEVKSCEGKVATPGLIDCHTHLVYGGSREHEFREKVSGCFLLRHPRSRRWNLSTVRATREASFDNLYDKSKRLLDYMLRHGVTTV